MRIIFAGTPEFSVPPLQKLVASEHEVVAVLTQPDRGVGRGRKVQHSAVKSCALAENIPVLQPQSLKSSEQQQILAELKPDLMVVVAYGLILPQAVLDIPKLGCWNIHASLLPRWRGAAPIHRAMLAGDETTGVGIMQMEAGLDTGPVFVQHECKIADTETLPQLHDRLSVMGAHALIECLELQDSGLLPRPMIQNESLVTYAHKLKKSESQIDWNETATLIERKIRSLNPWPGISAKIEGQDYKLWQAEVVSISSQVKPGEIVLANKSELVIQCGEQQLKILSLQKPGKKRLDIQQVMASNSQWFR